MKNISRLCLFMDFGHLFSFCGKKYNWKMYKKKKKIKCSYSVKILIYMCINKNVK